MTTMWASQSLAGWGRFPIVDARCARPERMGEARAALLDRGDKPILAYGLGRSYGDAALLRNGGTVFTTRLDRMLAFDAESGRLHCEAGVSLETIIDTFLPRGFFPPVVPGTQYVTVGGAIGCNIHGKNHHVDGCWGDHVLAMELLTAAGEIVRCTREHEPELFWATIGGMGLTGLVLTAELQLRAVDSPYIDMESIRVDSLEAFFEVSADSGDYTHTVSWIDCTKTGRHMGRGIFMRGRHADSDAQVHAHPFSRLAEAVARVVDGRPFEFDFLLNRATVTLFNEVYYRKQPPGVQRSVVGYQPFFFPLDAVANWNYAYGKRGFLQYQIVVPPDPEHRAIRAILERISGAGMASFLAVIKEFGESTHGGLSFPVPGVTLALDIPNVGPALFDLLDELDELVVDVGGRVYLGKDARLSRDNMRRMYPEWEKWKAVRDAWDPHRVFQSELGRRLGLV